MPGVETVNYWTHRDALDNKELPASLAIVGGGVIGMEDVYKRQSCKCCESNTKHSY